MAKKSDDLRRKALEILERRKKIPNKDLIAQDVDKLVEELSIFQVELELQNEELLQRQSDLNQAKEQYESLFDNSPNGYLLIDENFNIVKCNATITKMWGYGKSILLKTRLDKFIHPDDQDKAYLKCKTVFSSGDVTKCEIRIKSANEDWLHCRFDAFYEGEKDGQNIVRVSVVNIQEEVRIKSELEKLSQDRKEILESISDGFFVLDRNLIVKYFNDSAEKLLGRKRKEVLGAELFKAFPEAKNSVFEKNYLKGVREQKYLEFEVFFEVKPYKNWYKVRVFPNNGGIAVFFQVITKQKELEISLQDKNEEIARQNEELQSQNEELKTQNEEIRLSNEQLQKLNSKIIIEKQTAQNYLDIAGNMFIAIDKNGIVTLANQKASEVLGYPVEQIVGKNWFDHFLPDDKSQEIKDVFKKIMKGEIESVEYVENQVLCKDGGCRWIAWQNTDIRDEKGRITGTLSSGIDITDKYLADMELRKIEWMLSPKTKKEEQDFPIYGDLTKLNTERTILDSVGKDVLDDIVQDYLSLLDTSAAVYEKNGDYALGIFSSKWCRFLDEKSRGLCSQSDNKEALESGQWLCHESCWTDASKKAIETKKAADIKCAGGLNIYALPIWANNEVIGAINFGYGTPPKTSKDLSVISKKFKVPVEDLIEIAERYEERPNFIIDIAKERLAVSARLIGEIVERKNAKNALALSEEKFRSYIENAPDGIFITNEKGEYLEVNPAACQITGYAENELIGKKIPNLLQKEYLEKGAEHFQEVIKNGFAKGEIGFITKSGEERFWEIDAVKLSEIRFMGFAKDITERIKTQKALHESESKLKSVVENSTNMFYQHDTNHVLTFLSPQVKDILGYEVEEALKNWNTMASDHPINEVGFQHTMKAIETGKPQPTYELELLHKSGRKIRVEVREAPIIENGKTIAIAGSLNDITERKKAEEEIKISEKKFRRLVETASDAIYFMNSRGEILDTNDAAERMLGFTKNDILKKTIDQIDPNYPLDDFLKFWEAIPYEESNIFETTHKDKEGNLIPVEISGVKYKIDGEDFYYGIARDITERKAAMVVIAESEEKHRILLENTGAGIGYYTLDGKIVLFNRLAAEYMGGKPEDFIGKSIVELYGDDLGKQYRSRIKNAAKSAKSVEYEDEVKLPSGNLWFLSTYTKIKDGNGEVIGVQIISKDITDIKKTGLLIQKNLDSLKQSEDIALLGSYERNWQTGKGKWSDGFYRLLGLNPQEKGYSHEGFMKFIHKDDYERVDDYVKDTLVKKIDMDIKFRIVTKQNKVKHIHGIGKNRYDENGKPLLTVGVFRDISKQRLVEIALKESEEKFKSVFEYSNIGIALSDEKGNLLDANNEFLKILGYSRKEFLEMTIEDLTYGEDYEKEIPLIKSMLANEITQYRLEKRYFHKNGSTVWVDLSVAGRKDAKGKVDMLIGMVIDITEKKKVLEELEEHKTNLEIMVNERTEELASANEELQVTNEELSEKNQELEKFNELFVGREFRINELKEKIKELEEKLRQ